MCDGAIDEQQVQQLEAIITSDEEAMEFYIKTMWMNESIARHAAGDSSRIEQSALPVGDLTDSTQPQPIQQTDSNVGADPMSIAASENSTVIEKPKPAGLGQKNWSQSNGAGATTRSAVWPSVLAIAAALALIVGLGSLMMLSGDRNNGTDGSMTDRHHADDNVKFVVQKVDAEGIKRTELSDGTIVIARSGAKFAVEKRRELRLEKGELYLIVAKSDTPFIIRTNDGEVHATGTRFSVSASDNTQAAVAQGTVVLKSSVGDVALGAGQKGTLVESKAPTRGPAKRISYLVNWAKEALAQDELLVEALPRENGLVAIDPYGQEAKLSLRQYKVDVYIEDGVARTTIDQTFFNHNPWNTEGTFYFPLPQDASVSRLAMYVFGQLNEGGMVTRQRGQEIYTDILYQRRDPALLEMMEGNMFKMRIFPLEGRQEKRIFLSYTQNLEELYGAIKYFFPMEHTNDITQNLSIRVHIKDGAKRYDPKSSTHDLKATIDGDDLVLEYDAQKIKPDQDFLLNLLPQTEKPESEVRVAVCEKDKLHYLAAKLNPELTGVNQPEPRQWIVLNDVSGSRSDLDIEAQRYVLERLALEADDEDSVFLIDVNTVARNVSSKPVNVRSVDIKPILNHRPERVLGATNLEAGFEAAAEVVRKHKLENPHILYLGDGVATDGEKAITDLPRLIPLNCKFIGVGIGKKVDSMFLQEAANQTGGTFASINPNEDIDWRVFDLLASINTPRMTNIEVELLDQNGRPLSAIAYPSSTVLAAGETLTVTAMSDKSLPDSIRFQGRVGNEVVTKTVSVKEAKANAEYLPRLWAKRHIDELLKSDMSDEKEEIISLSKDFYVVTPYTSLIVLEDDEMYQEYNVERGRKDHWASYDAPETIDVVKEPLEHDWRWGWGQFEGEESKIDVSIKPKTAQEIIDNIQIRVNAPFYIWNNQQPGQPPSPSRTGLYQLCNRDTSGELDPSKWLTLYYLWAAGDRQAAIDWNQEVATPATPATPKAQAQPMVPLGDSQIETRFLEEPGLLDLVYKIKEGDHKSHESADFARIPMPMLGRPALPNRLAGAAPLPLNHEMSLSVAQAIDTRWSRMQRDIDKFNSQYHYGGWQSDSIDAQNINLNWSGNQISEILEDFGFDPLIELDSDIVEAEALEPPQRLLSGKMLSFNGQSPFLIIFQRPFVPVLRDNLADVTFSRISAKGWASSRGLSLDQYRSVDYLPLGDRPFFRERCGQPRLYFATSQGPIRTQPGMTAILAADHLSKRLDELERLAGEQPDGLDKSQLAEQQAMQVALKNVGRASVRLEQNGQFWGHQGWSYRPRPQTINPPTVQVYPNYRWSFDLTRYAGGLYSNTNDMIEEVAKQYGSPKPLGKIDQQSRKRIEEARSNFKPVEIRIDEDGTKFFVGPDDRFAFSSRNDMYLSEQLICDGQHIVQIYDELGLVARREATPSRLEDLRQLAPHMVSDVDSMIGQFDVELVQSNDQSTTIKLTIAEPEEVAAGESDSGSDDEEKSETEKENQEQKFEEDSVCVIIKFDNQGRILNRHLLFNDQKLHSFDFSYDDDKVTIKWKVQVRSEADEKASEEKAASFETGESSYLCKELDADESTFVIDLDEQVVIDMPLKKPDFYKQQIDKIEQAATEEAELDLSKLNRETTEELIRLYHHFSISHLQDFSHDPWSGPQHAHTTIPKLKNLKKHVGQKYKKGELAILGTSRDFDPQQIIADDEVENFEKTPLFRFIHSKRHRQPMKPSEAGEEVNGLIQHISMYDWIHRNPSSENVQLFRDRFKESPLALALLSNSGDVDFRADELLKLNEDPQWEGIALLAATSLRSEKVDEKISAAFWKWQEKLAKNDLHPILVDSLLQRIQSVDKQRLSKYLSTRFDQIEKLESLPALVDFTERVSALGEKELADKGYALMRKQLKIDSEQPLLLHRFAYAQALWAGSRDKQALKQYELILAELEKKQIQPSPGFVAAMARLCHYTGDKARTVELEERALRLEQPYLPSAINLQAFRQRYQWLWGQYDGALAEIKSDDPKRSEKMDDLIARASVTWHHWNEVDRDNAGLPGQMATLLKKAGRDELAWEYLSTSIDKRPRDASTYQMLGSWYQQRGDMETASKWYEQAPQWDTANPQWILIYATSLKELGKKKEAKIELKKIVDGKWAPGLENYVKQAQDQLNEL